MCRSNPSIHQRLLLRGLVIFFTAWQGQQSRRWDFPVTCDHWRRDEGALHYTQATVIIIMEKKQAVVSGVEPACPWTLPRRQ